MRRGTTRGSHGGLARSLNALLASSQISGRLPSSRRNALSTWQQQQEGAGVVGRAGRQITHTALSVRMRMGEIRGYQLALA